jgi:hypothetical protein
MTYNQWSGAASRPDLQKVTNGQCFSSDPKGSSVKVTAKQDLAKGFIL